MEENKLAQSILTEFAKVCGYKIIKNNLNETVLRKIEGRDSITYIKFWKTSKAHAKGIDAGTYGYLMTPITHLEQSYINKLCSAWGW